MLSAHLSTKKSSEPPPPRPAAAGAQATHWTDRQSPCAHSACHEEPGSPLDRKYKVRPLGLPPFPSQLPLMREWHRLTWMSTKPGRRLTTKPTCLGSQDARMGEVDWELVSFLCFPFYLHFLFTLSTCPNNPRRDPSANLNQEVRVTTPRVQKRLSPQCPGSGHLSCIPAEVFRPCGEAPGPAGLGYWEVGRMGELGEGRTAAHHLQIRLTKQMRTEGSRVCNRNRTNLKWGWEAK